MGETPSGARQDWAGMIAAILSCRDASFQNVTYVAVTEATDEFFLVWVSVSSKLILKT